MKNLLVEEQNIVQTRLYDQASQYGFLLLLKQEMEKKLLTELTLNTYLKQLSHQQSSPKISSPKISTEQSGILVKKEQSQTPTENKAVRNQTKNIPKNFGKAIITFIENHQTLVKRALGKQVTYGEYVATLRERKKNINSIADLRALWLDEEFEYAKATRKISLYFLKKVSLKYIFSSRITNHTGHIKYRNRLINVLKYPHQFTSIKTQ